MNLKKYLSLNVLFFFFFIFSYGCSVNKAHHVNKRKINKDIFILSDKAGKFKMMRETGKSSHDRGLVVKTKIFSEENLKKVLEKTLIISDPGFIRGKTKTLRPRQSLYHVWFDGKRYSTSMKINLKNKALNIFLKSPEKQWNGEREVFFPKNTGPFCFFGQLIECLQEIDFFEKLKDGKKKYIYIIWESYPYIQEQYLNLPIEVFSKAEVSYDGKNKKGEKRITLEVAGQMIFYVLDHRDHLSKIFWVAQGLSMVKEEK